MKKFSTFKIATPKNPFIGDSIKMSRILNREIAVYDFKIGGSKFEKGNATGKCLTMAISLGETRHIVFTGSIALMDTIAQIPKENFPFTTTIVENNERYEFT
jgi:hypothetical protein